MKDNLNAICPRHGSILAAALPTQALAQLKQLPWGSIPAEVL